MNNQQDVIKSWRTIVSILVQTGYDFIFQEDIEIVSKCLQEKFEIDKKAMQNENKAFTK